MRIDNWQHLQAPIEAPDDSEERAAFAGYVLDTLPRVRALLDALESAAKRENTHEAQEAIRNASFELHIMSQPYAEEER